MNRKHWWQLTEAEADRLNPPVQLLTTDEDGNEYLSEIDDWDWLPVGHIPRPRTRLGWFVYDLVHGFAMRYPWHKVIGFAFASLRVDHEVVVNVDMSKLQWQECDGRMVAETEYGEFEAYWPSLEPEADGRDIFEGVFPVSGEPE